MDVVFLGTTQQGTFMNYFVEIMDDLYMVDLWTFQVFMSCFLSVKPREVTSHWATFRIWIPPQLGCEATGEFTQAKTANWRTIICSDGTSPWVF